MQAPWISSQEVLRRNAKCSSLSTPSATTDGPGTSPDGPVVVGVGPSGRLSEGTLGFAAGTAEQLGIDVLLVHVVPRLLSGPHGVADIGVAMGQMVADGQARLDETVRRVRDLRAVGGGVEAPAMRRRSSGK